MPSFPIRRLASAFTTRTRVLLSKQKRAGWLKKEGGNLLRGIPSRPRAGILPCGRHVPQASVAGTTSKPEGGRPSLLWHAHYCRRPTQHPARRNGLSVITSDPKTGEIMVGPCRIACLTDHRRQRREVRHRPGLLVCLSRRSDGVVQFRPRLALILGLVQMPNCAETVRVAIPVFGDQHPCRPQVLLDAFEATRPRDGSSSAGSGLRAAAAGLLLGGGRSAGFHRHRPQPRLSFQLRLSLGRGKGDHREVVVRINAVPGLAVQIQLAAGPIDA